MDTYRDLGDRFNAAHGLTDLGDTYRAAGDHTAARDAWRQALALLDQLGHPDAEQVRQRLQRTGAAQLS